MKNLVIFSSAPCQSEPGPQNISEASQQMIWKGLNLHSFITEIFTVAGQDLMRP